MLSDRIDSQFSIRGEFSIESRKVVRLKDL